VSANNFLFFSDKYSIFSHLFIYISDALSHPPAHAAEVGRVFAGSQRAASEFPDRSAAVRQAVSLARCFQCPLTEVYTDRVSPGVGSRQ
jgi:hypothetical protein